MKVIFSHTKYSYKITLYLRETVKSVRFVFWFLYLIKTHFWVYFLNTKLRWVWIYATYIRFSLLLSFLISCFCFLPHGYMSLSHICICIHVYIHTHTHTIKLSPKVHYHPSSFPTLPPIISSSWWHIGHIRDELLFPLLRTATLNKQYIYKERKLEVFPRRR